MGAKWVSDVSKLSSVQQSKKEKRIHHHLSLCVSLQWLDIELLLSQEGSTYSNKVLKYSREYKSSVREFEVE